MFKTPDLTDRVNLRLLLLKPSVYGDLELRHRLVSWFNPCLPTHHIAIATEPMNRLSSHHFHRSIRALIILGRIGPTQRVSLLFCCKSLFHYLTKLVVYVGGSLNESLSVFLMLLSNFARQTKKTKKVFLAKFDRSIRLFLQTLTTLSTLSTLTNTFNTFQDGCLSCPDPGSQDD